MLSKLALNIPAINRYLFNIRRDNQHFYLSTCLLIERLLCERGIGSVREGEPLRRNTNEFSTNRGGMKMKPISLNSRIGSRIFISQGAEESKRFPFALKIAEFGNKIIIYTLFDFPHRESNLTDSDRIPRGKREWRGCSFHANQIIFRFLHSLHTPGSKSTLQARNIFLRLDWKNAKSTQAWTGQEAVRWGWPGGGSRAVRDVLCGKDTMTLTVRNLVARAPLRVVGISLLGSTRWNERPSPFKIFLRFSSTNYISSFDRFEPHWTEVFRGETFFTVPQN